MGSRESKSRGQSSLQVCRSDLRTRCEPKRVLLVHKYNYRRGGADVVFLEMKALLEQEGHHVCIFAMHHPLNESSPYSADFVSEVDLRNAPGLWQKLRAAGRILYSLEAKRKIARLLDKEHPDIAHLHSICHHISPSILPELRRHGVPIVTTLHDWKLVCPMYTMLREGRPCELCKGGRYWQAPRHGCKEGFLGSGLLALEMYLHHTMLHLYDLVDVFISPSRFLQEKVQQMGFHGEVVYLPNFVDASRFSPVYGSEDDSLVYFGRLSPEKGLLTLLEAAKGLSIKVKIIGDGPQRPALEEKAAKDGIDNVSFLGYMTGEPLKGELHRARAVVLPSEWYENNPLAVIEAFALGKPVIASHIGGIPELVRDGETGMTYEPWNADALRETIVTLFAHPREAAEMGRAGRSFVERELNADKHYAGLMDIYRRASAKRTLRTGTGA